MNIWFKIPALFVAFLLIVFGIISLQRRSDYLIMLKICNQHPSVSFCKEVEEDFVKKIGYWKDIYKAYHLAAYQEYMRGNSKKAKDYIKKSIHYHPYYPNGYKMLVYLSDYKNKDACNHVYESIMNGARPTKELISKCLEN